MLIELIVASAFLLIGKESMYGGERAQRTAPWPLGSYVWLPAPPSLHAIGGPDRQTAHLTR